MTSASDMVKFEILGFGYFRVFIDYLIANMYYEIRNRMAMKEKNSSFHENFQLILSHRK